MIWYCQEKFNDFIRKRCADEQPLNRNGDCHVLKFELKTFGLKISLSYSPIRRYNKKGNKMFLFPVRISFSHDNGRPYKCWTISFFEEVAVRAGSFKPKRFLIGCINQDPVGFNVAVA